MTSICGKLCELIHASWTLRKLKYLDQLFSDHFCVHSASLFYPNLAGVTILHQHSEFTNCELIVRSCLEFYLFEDVSSERRFECIPKRWRWLEYQLFPIPTSMNFRIVGRNGFQSWLHDKTISKVNLNHECHESDHFLETPHCTQHTSHPEEKSVTWSAKHNNF